VTREQALAAVAKILTGYPQVTVRELNHNAPSWCDPDGPMVRILKAAVEELRGFEPKGVVSLAATDTRLWRYVDVPAYVYGGADRDGLGRRVRRGRGVPARRPNAYAFGL
jgi:succinyl-diaminopimelate desuccinylase